MKISLLLLTVILVTSCSTSGRICGGSGGKRCVETVTKQVTQKINS